MATDALTPYRERNSILSNLTDGMISHLSSLYDSVAEDYKAFFSGYARERTRIERERIWDQRYPTNHHP